jgi:hypothetical protein
MSVVTDYFGNEIRPGDIVAYATRQSSTTTMHHGEVIAVNQKPHAWRENETVTTLQVKHLGLANWGDMKPCLTSRPVTISCINRVINLTAYADSHQRC